MAMLDIFVGDLETEEKPARGRDEADRVIDSKNMVPSELSVLLVAS